MTKLRRGLPKLPTRLRNRPVDHRGYPVPWFVTDKDEAGNWEFRWIRPERIVEAAKKNLCWACGKPLGKTFTFVVGSISLITRLHSEPAMHRPCALFSMRACPFLSHPAASRRTRGAPGTLRKDPAMIEENPGVVVTWTTDYRKWHVSAKGRILVRLGNPSEIGLWCEGRRLTRAEFDELVAPRIKEWREEDPADSEDDTRFRFAAAALYDIVTMPLINRFLENSKDEEDGLHTAQTCPAVRR